MKTPSILAPLTLIAATLITGGCQNSATPKTLSGYVEGIYIYLAAPESGWLESVPVKEGDHLNSGDLAFKLDTGLQDIQLAQAESQIEQARQKRNDLKTGARQPQLEQIEANLAAARANLKYAESERKRQLKLVTKKLASPDTADKVIQAWRVAQAQVNALQASLANARLGARPEQQAAAETRIDIANKGRDAAQWQKNDRLVHSKRSGRVEQLFYRSGEFVRQGASVIALLPKANIKIRFYIPEAHLSDFQPGQTITFTRDGSPDPIPAKITFIATSAEYTPPVIFSNDVREKLVFMAEAIPQEVNLRPGQPVDVLLP